ncbi:FixH family protein [Mesobacillus sp. LC4]
MKKLILLILSTVLVFVGCSNKSTEDLEIPELIEVAVETTPATLTVNETIRIEAKVTQGKEVVKDADEMKFEIWKDGQEDDQHEKLSGKLDKEKGVYYAEKIFDEAGKYNVIAHVTARDMHNMPKIQLEISE